MDKKENIETSQERNKEFNEEEFTDELAGFPDSVDFKKFLGCGG